jgi:predicted amidohydrolase
VKITLVQMSSVADKTVNIATALKLVEQAVTADQPQLIALPETWSSVGGDFATKMREAEELPANESMSGGESYEAMRKIAQEYGVVVHGGSINERVGDRLYNTTVVFSPEGRELARYRKVHLFDADTSAGTGYRESLEYGSGDKLVTYMAENLTVGCVICYDLRFAEQFLALRSLGAQLIVMPSAFTFETGRDHWEILLRARAIETQCWIAAPGMWGSHRGPRGEERTTFGHTMLVDPWGNITACAPTGDGWITGAIDIDRMEMIRSAMPVMKHRTPLDRRL